MNILMINKYYFIKGGSERYYFELSKKLTEHGHTVIPFAMKSPRNFPTEYERYFVDNIEYQFNSPVQKIANAPRVFSRMMYSFQAKQNIEELIQLTKPDIAHIHMIEHQISPSILHSLKKYNIPVILTAHQSKLICPNYRLFNWSKMEVCEKCLGGKFYHPVLEKCHKNSRMASLFISVESYFHKWIKIYENNTDIIHVPSKFFGKKFTQAGFDSKKIEQLYYTIKVDEYTPNYENEDYFLYYGRLEEAKGLLTILKAMRKVKKSKLLIVGEGDHRPVLENFVKENQLKNVEFTGYKSGTELKKTVANCKFVLVASECYDNSPLVVYESFASGKPVIGAMIGGIPELVAPHKDGLLFQAGNHAELADRINYFLKHPELVKQFGRNAREKAEQEFSPEVHYQKMMEKYQRLVQNKHSEMITQN